MNFRILILRPIVFLLVIFVAHILLKTNVGTEQKFLVYSSHQQVKVSIYTGCVILLHNARTQRIQS